MKLEEQQRIEAERADEYNPSDPDAGKSFEQISDEVSAEIERLGDAITDEQITALMVRLENANPPDLTITITEPITEPIQIPHLVFPPLLPPAQPYSPPQVITSEAKPAGVSAPRVASWELENLYKLVLAAADEYKLPESERRGWINMLAVNPTVINAQVKTMREDEMGNVIGMQIPGVKVTFRNQIRGTAERG